MASSKPAPSRAALPTVSPVFDLGGEWGALSVAPEPGDVAEFVHRGGEFRADLQDVGHFGSGRFVQAGGVNLASEVRLGAGAGGSGAYELAGSLVVRRPPVTAALAGGIHVGGAGEGLLRLGGQSEAGAVYQPRGPDSPRPMTMTTSDPLPASTPPPSLVVRGESSGSGTVVGWGGAIGDGGAFVNNGRVIADGAGRARELIFLGYGAVTNTIDNPPAGGTNGWFARAGGRLTLPLVNTAAGSGTYTWGEDAADATIDLVNSVRFTLHSAEHAGRVNVSLLDKTRPEVPALPQGHTFVGVWSIDLGTTRPAGGVDLVVRYDDGLAHDLGLNEPSLKLWQYEGGQWLRINDESFARDLENHILSGHGGGDMTFFAVSAPEPGFAGVMVLAAGALLFRRTRRG